MDTRLLDVCVIMNNLGGFKIDSLEDRVFLQKAIYLFQVIENTIDLRFRFNWYLRGPYSKSLTQCAYEIEGNEQVKEMAKELQLRPAAKRATDALNVLNGKKPGIINPNSKWLELLSSIHYLIHISKPKDNLTPEEVKELLSEYGKAQFNIEEIKLAWDRLSELGLIKNKTISISALS